jgi:hypothetical protein
VEAGKRIVYNSLAGITNSEEKSISFTGLTLRMTGNLIQRYGNRMWLLGQGQADVGRLTYAIPAGVGVDAFKPGGKQPNGFTIDEKQMIDHAGIQGEFTDSFTAAGLQVEGRALLHFPTTGSELYFNVLHSELFKCRHEWIYCE